jgi:uncharacterized membrane protein YgdD (TMEM256/DUF423 family)
MNRPAGVLAAFCGALAVLLGAFGAHALRGSLDAGALQVWRTAVDYQFWHALALLAAAYAPASRWRSVSVIAFAAGIIAFCGSLYALALGAPRPLGIVTPIGGVALFVGWLVLATAFLRTAR